MSEEVEDDDLEDCWADLRRGRRKEAPAIEVVQTQGLEAATQLARELTIHDVTQFVEKTYADKPLTPNTVREIVSKGINLFVSRWRDIVRRQNLAALMEIVLEKQGLTPDEMREFVTALPLSILTKVAQSTNEGATGIHALLALEFVRRNHGPDYRIFSVGLRTRVTFPNSSGSGEVGFFLDEPFKLDD